MSVEANKALVRRFVEEVLGRGDFAALAELAAPGCVEHTAPPGQPPAEGTVAHYLVLWRAAEALSGRERQVLGLLAGGRPARRPRGGWG